MEYLPLFVDLKGRSVLVVGGGEVAARKIHLLIRAGANIKVVAKTLCLDLNKAHQSGRISWLGKSFNLTMMNNVFLVIAATSNKKLNAWIVRCAERRHLLVNVVDNQPFCSFIFPSIIDRSPIMMAISSGGMAPVLVRILREKLESMLPNFLGPMAALAGSWRGRVKRRFKSMLSRKRFWEQAFNGRFASLVSQGRLVQAENLLSNAINSKIEYKKGEIALVGAGPGDSGLLTLRGLQLMQQADAVLYDYLVSKEVLDLVRRDATKICVGKRCGEQSMTQHQINCFLIELAQQGKKVVRLKGGDPFVFGRGGEELEIIATSGIPFQVVPGITAALGAAAYSGIPLTHRNYSHSITFITGSLGDNEKFIDWQTLALGHQTIAIYMGAVKSADISSHLIHYGRSAQTPVAVISRGTLIDQSVQIGSLAVLEELACKATPPALILIGEVVPFHNKFNWFGQQNLSVQKRASVVNLM